MHIRTKAHSIKAQTNIVKYYSKLNPYIWLIEKALKTPQNEANSSGLNMNIKHAKTGFIKNQASDMYLYLNIDNNKNYAVDINTNNIANIDLIDSSSYTTFYNGLSCWSFNGSNR